MTTTAEGPLAGQAHGVIDLHTHPALKTTLFYRHLWKRHWHPAGTFPPTMRNDIDALIDGGVKALLAAVYVIERPILEDVWPTRYLRAVYPPLDRHLGEAPDDMARECMNDLAGQITETNRRRGRVVAEFAKGYADLHRIMAEGKVCFVHSMEGAHHLNGRLDNLDDFFARGLAHMIIPHFYGNEATPSAVDPIPDNQPLKKLGLFRSPRDPEAGLTAWGKELVEKMCELGIVPDVTHGTPTFRRQVYEVARAQARPRPVIMSHVGVHALAPYAMNPTPEDIRQIADSGGVVGIIAMTWWLHRPERHASMEVIKQTIDHLIQHGGEEVVGFGSDFDGFTGVPTDWRSPRDYRNVREMLLRHYTEAQAEKFLSGNADRVLRLGWGKA